MRARAGEGEEHLDPSGSELTFSVRGAGGRRLILSFFSCQEPEVGAAEAEVGPRGERTQVSHTWADESRLVLLWSDPVQFGSLTKTSIKTLFWFLGDCS